MEKLFIYLALAKPALPGQLDLLVSSQSNANVSKYFCLFQCAAQNKSSDFWAAQNISLFVSSTNFYHLFLSLPKIGWSCTPKLNYRAAQNAWFSEGVVRFLSFLCRSSPGFDPKMDIPEQHKIKSLFTSSTKLNNWKRSNNNNNLCLIAAWNSNTCFSTL